MTTDWSPRSIHHTQAEEIELDRRREMWRVGLARLEQHIEGLLQAKPGKGWFGSEDLNRLLGDVVTGIENVGPRERIELLRFTVAKFPSITSQVFKTIIPTDTVREFVKAQRPRGLVAMSSITPPFPWAKSEMTMIYTSDSTASMLVALLYTPEK